MPFNKIVLDAEASAKLQNITSIYNSLESSLAQLDDCREKMWAVTSLEQSHMWLTKAIEREQLERNFRAGQSLPPQTQAVPQQQPIKQAATPPMSPDASILAESRQKIDSLLDSIKDLTDTVAVTGFPLPKKG